MSDDISVKSDDPRYRGKNRIIVTGIGGRLGRAFVRRLHREFHGRIVGIDRRDCPGLPRDIEHARVDIRSKRARDIFRGNDVLALVHLGVMHNPRQPQKEHHSWNVQGTQRLLDACVAYNVPKVVVLSSANVYGPHPDNPQFLPEDAPLMAAADFPAIRDLIEVDMLASSYFWKVQACDTVILRPVHILGHVKNAPSNYLRLPYVPTLLGFDPMLQIIHQEDVVTAVMCALKPKLRGIYNITGPGEVPLSAILKELNKPSVPVPHLIARAMLQTLWRAKVTNFPVPELGHIQYVCMVDGSRARDVLGFAPKHSLKETIRAVLTA